MADIAAWVAIRNVLCEGNNIGRFIAEGTIKAGMVVAFNTTGVSFSVLAVTKGTTGACVGVAIEDAVSGEIVAVAMDGCIVNVENGDDTAAIDAGDICEGYGVTTTGTVQTAVVMDAGVILVMKYQVGIAVDIIAAAGTGRMLVSCGRFVSANNA
jgi:hypothetical protein